MRRHFASFLITLAATQVNAAPPIAGGGLAAQPMKECGGDLALLNQVSGWQTQWPTLWNQIAAPGASARTSALADWAKADEALAADIATMRSSLVSGATAPRAVALRVAQQAEDLLSGLDATSVETAISDDPDFAVRWGALFETEIKPAIRDYVRFLKQEYAPLAGEKSALAASDGACSRNAVAWWTSATIEPSALEEIGERIIVETRADLERRDRQGRRVDRILKDLRKPDRDATGANLIAASEAALARAQAALPRAFVSSPETPIIVEAMAAHLQPSFPAGYYVPPAEGGPAKYVINPSRPEDRRLMAEAIAFHEGLPGHHLFFDYPRQAPLEGFSAGIIEGWAIYAERVADELGLYATPRDAEGMLAKRLWAASRLIVEPRLHDGRWTRQDAIDFMSKATAMPRAEIEIEVDRYLAMPGQSISYALGYDTIVTARESARLKMGEAFDIKAFHDVVLKPGVRPLADVEHDVMEWAAKTAG